MHSSDQNSSSVEGLPIFPLGCSLPRAPPTCPILGPSARVPWPSQVLLWSSGSSYLLFELISVLLCCCLPSGVIVYPSLSTFLVQLSFSRTARHIFPVSSVLLTFVVWQVFMVLFNSVLNCDIMLTYLREPHVDTQYKLIRRAQQQLHLLRVLIKIHLLVSCVAKQQKITHTHI